MSVSKKFRRFLVKLGEDLRAEDIKKLKFVLADDVPRGELEKVADGVDLFNMCLKRSIIDEDNLDDLIEDLTTIKRVDLAQRCQVHAKMNQQSGPPQVSSPPNHLPSPQNQNHLPSPQNQNHSARPNAAVASAPTSPPVAKVLPRSTSAPTDHDGEELDDRETPLKTVIRTERVEDSVQQDGRNQSENQAGENPQTPLSQPMSTPHTSGNSVSTVWTSHSDSSVSVDSGDVEMDGPQSSFNPHSISLHGPVVSTSSLARSFVASVSLHSDRSLLELQRRQQLADGPRARDTARETPRQAAARALIDREGVSSVGSNNTIEFPTDAEDSYSTKSSEHWASLKRSDAALLAGQAAVARHSSRVAADSPRASTGASQNPLADGVNAIVNRLSQSFSAMAVTSGVQQPPGPNNGSENGNNRPGNGNNGSENGNNGSENGNNGSENGNNRPGNGSDDGLQFQLFSKEPQENMADWLTQGARPRAPLSVAANPDPNPAAGPPPPPALLPDRPATVAFVGVPDSEPGERRGRERTTGGRRDHNRVSSTRTATYNPPSPSNAAAAAAAAADTSPRRRQQSLSPPRRLQREVPGGKQLRAYQQELAASALEGNNCIICAPTGSGKTMTAAHICRQRMRLARPGRFKTLFIVCIRNLVSQQALALSEMFPEDNNVVKAFGDDDTLKECLRVHDVVVVTAQILVNSLQEPAAAGGHIDITDIDLLIMDECHHANLDHPYNNIMRVLLLRGEAEAGARLPQVLGLTASLGVGGHNTTPIEHYILMCANLNARRIDYVRHNTQELLTHNPKPAADQIKAVPSRLDDTFNATIRRMIRAIEGRTRFFLNKSSPAAGTQEYNAWVVQQQAKAAEAGGGQAARDVVDSCEALNVLSTALEYYADLRAIDVLKEHLEPYFHPNSLADEPLPHKRWIFDMYDDRSDQLEEAAEAEAVNDQPKLGALQKLLFELFENNSEPKAILLSRTIFSTVVLLKFVQESAELRQVGVRAARLVGKGMKKDCMTDQEQEQVLRDFRSDKTNLLIATDVAQEGLDIVKCNLLIRYNFVSNEIGSVQAKGRARQKQSQCYLIVNGGSKEHLRELENLQREHRMQDALGEIDTVPDLPQRIENKKRELLAQYQADLERRRVRGNVVDAHNVIIVCKKCKAELGRGTDMIKKGTQYVNTSPEYPECIIFRRYAQSRVFRYDAQLGLCACREPSCQADLGQKMRYNQGRRREGYTLTMKSIMFRILHTQGFDDDEYKAYKKWSAVPFHSQIPEESLTD